MLYKVFLVEDEIVAREGIRDNVQWASMGFTFCGEAPDGEMALPLIEATQPDVLITDIKMPFMDGLQLCKLVKERLPAIKIIILSGHDEFHYAQEAVKLGVTEYLLKPVGVQEMHTVLQSIAARLNQERQQKVHLEKLKEEIDDNRRLLRERLLLRLVVGGVSPLEVIEKSHALGFDLIAPWYQVVVIHIELGDVQKQMEFHQYQFVRQMIANLVEPTPDILLFKKDMEELVLLFKGNQADALEQEALFFTELIKKNVMEKLTCHLTFGFGQPKQRMGDIPASFTEAVYQYENQARYRSYIELDDEADKAELLKLDKAQLENFLRFGNLEEFEAVFSTYIQPLSDTALTSYMIKNYLFIDIVLTTAKFVHQLGGEVDQIIPEISTVETLLMNIKTIEQIKGEVQKIFASALVFRDTHTGNPYTLLIAQAKEYLNQQYSNPDVSLQDVAGQVNLSSSHFSTIFSQETGTTFKEYLTGLRLEKAKELLSMTSRKSFEIAEQVGYNDPHYFSYVFKKYTGFSPKEFRLKIKTSS